MKSGFLVFAILRAKANVDVLDSSELSYQMKNRLILIVCVSAPVMGQVPADPAPSNLTYQLEYATRDADAHHDCPSQRNNGYAKDFQRRYGPRIQHLMDIHLARSGPDPTFIILTDCRGFSGSEAEEDARHHKAMNDFEATLRELEREFESY